MRHMPGLVLLLLVVPSCSKKSPPNPVVTVSSSAVDAAAVDAGEAKAQSWTFEERKRDYDETTSVFRVLYPRYCRVKNAEATWDDVHDNTRSYTAATTTLRTLDKVAHEEAAKPLGVAANEQCAKRVRAYLTTFLEEAPKITAKNIACVEAHRAEIEKGLKSATFSEAAPAECSAILPVPGTAMDCVRNLFLCDGTNCEYYGVANRLGLACDPRENTKSPLRFHDWK